MGLFDFVGRLFGSRDPSDGGGELSDSDEELLALYRGRDALSASDRQAVRREFVLRGLPLPAGGPRQPLTMSELEAHRVETSVAPAGAFQPCGADVTMRPGGVALVAFDPTAPLIFTFDSWRGREGDMSGDGVVLAVGAAAKSPNEDQASSEAPTAAGVEAVDGGRWRIAGEDAATLVGLFDALELTRQQGPLNLVGGVRWPDDDEQWRELAAALGDEGAGLNLRRAWIPDDLLGHDLERTQALLPRLGVSVSVGGRGLAPRLGSQAAVARILGGGGPDASDGDAPTTTTTTWDAADAIAFLVVCDHLQAAQQLLDKAYDTAEGAEGDASLAFAAGFLAEIQGDEATAASRYEISASADTPHPLALANLAGLSLAAGDTQRAVALCEAAIARAPSVAPVLGNLVLARLAVGDEAGALEAFQDAQNEMRPLHAALLEGWLSRGDASEGLMTRTSGYGDQVLLAISRAYEVGDDTLAGWWIQRLSVLDPAPIDALVAQLRAADETDDAWRASADAILSRFKGPWPIHFERGNRRFVAGDFAGAAADFRACTAASHEQHDAAVNLAMTLAKLGQSAEARSVIDWLQDDGEDDTMIATLTRLAGARG